MYSAQSSSKHQRNLGWSTCPTNSMHMIDRLWTSHIILKFCPGDRLGRIRRHILFEKNNFTGLYNFSFRHVIGEIIINLAFAGQQRARTRASHCIVSVAIFGPFWVEQQ